MKQVLRAAPHRSGKTQNPDRAVKTWTVGFEVRTAGSLTTGERSEAARPGMYSTPPRLARRSRAPLRLVRPARTSYACEATGQVSVRTLRRGQTAGCRHRGGGRHDTAGCVDLVPARATPQTSSRTTSTSIMRAADADRVTHARQFRLHRSAFRSRGEALAREGSFQRTMSRIASTTSTDGSASARARRPHRAARRSGASRCRRT